MRKQFGDLFGDEVNLDRMLAAIGLCVRGRRQRAGWSQRELARRARLSPSEIQHVENARRDFGIGTLLCICAALAISAVELLAEAQRVVSAWERMRR